ncbi:MAG: peptidylprolyl isomerase [Chloroflexi bacterium]|nr:peptidylprolyl isomerase [Chloroflexota bacterium]
MLNLIWRFSLLMVITITVLAGTLLAGCSGSDEPSNPVVIMKTNYGDITIELFEDKVPVTVDNFVHLVKDGFYTDVVFHRISDDFMIQAGVLAADGTQKISPYGPINLEIHPEVRHIDGAISMARTNDPNSATSQFFICDGPQPFLDDGYAAFGVVTEGIEVVREIAAQPHDNSNPAGGGIPLSPILIESIELKK